MKAGLDRRPRRGERAAGIRRSRDVTPDSEKDSSDIFPPDYWSKETDPVESPSSTFLGDTLTHPTHSNVADSEPTDPLPPPARDTQTPPPSHESPTHPPPRRINLRTVLASRRPYASRSRAQFLGSIVKIGRAVLPTHGLDPDPTSSHPAPHTPTTNSPDCTPPRSPCATRNDAAATQRPSWPLSLPSSSRFSTPSIGATSAAMARLGFHTDRAIDSEDLRAMAAILFQKGIVERDPNDGLRFTPSREPSVLRTHEDSSPALLPSFRGAFVDNAASQVQDRKGKGRLYK